MISSFGLIDKDTPQSAYTHTSIEDGSTMELVFSDEFETPGRTFFPGDDPYWEAADLHYWSTNNLEWYDPRQVTTKDGKLVITLDKIMTKNMKSVARDRTLRSRRLALAFLISASSLTQLYGRDDHELEQVLLPRRICCRICATAGEVSRRSKRSKISRLRRLGLTFHQPFSPSRSRYRFG